MFQGNIGNNNARYITTEVASPVNSTLRKRRAAVIPPFSFTGELEIGVSGFWYPTTTIELTQASVTASGDGTATALLYVLKEEPVTNRPLTVCSFSLGATRRKITTSIQRVVVTPYDKLFIASYADSGHSGVVIQLVGEMMS